MKAFAKKFTYNHVKRLYHISRFLTFVFIAGTCIYGFFAILSFSGAEDISSSQSVSVSAMVPGAQPGPTTMQNGNSESGVPSPSATSNTKIKNNITIIPKNSQGKIVLTGYGGEKITLELFKTQYPTFGGMVPFPKALVKIEIKNKVTLRSTIFSSDDGSWEWQSLQPLFLGNNTLRVTVEDPNDPTTMSSNVFDFYIDPSSVAINAKPVETLVSKNQYSNLFDVSATIPQYFKAITAGGELVTNIRLINFGSPGKPVDVVVEYKIQNSRGEEVLKTSETLAVATQISYLKTFYTSESLEEGPYQLIVSVPSRNIVATAYDTFEIIKKTPVGAGGTGPVQAEQSKNGIIEQGLLGIMFLASLVAYFEYNKSHQLTKIIKRIGEADFISAA